MRLGYHNHAGYIGGPVWDFSPFIERLDAATVGYYFDVRLMEKYRDLPMDLAVAALVRVAERDDITRVFRLDRRTGTVFSTFSIARTANCCSARNSVGSTIVCFGL